MRHLLHGYLTWPRRGEQIAATHGLETPLVKRLVRLIHEIEDGTRPMELANLDALAALP